MLCSAIPTESVALKSNSARRKTFCHISVASEVLNPDISENENVQIFHKDSSGVKTTHLWDLLSLDMCVLQILELILVMIDVAVLKPRNDMR